MSSQHSVSDDRLSGPYFNRIVTWIAYAYLMRVPILIGLALILIPVLASFGLRPLLQNLFILSVEGTIWTTAMALSLCWGVLLTARLVLLNGERFRLPQALTIHKLEPKNTLFIK